MYSFFLSKNAKEDLWRIYEYGVYKFGTNKADEYFNLIQDCFDKIASNPFMFPVFIENDTYRYYVCGADTIYYNISENNIEVITIIGRQNFV